MPKAGGAKSRRLSKRFSGSSPRSGTGASSLPTGPRVEGDMLSGTCFETDYASFLYWRQSGFPDPEVKNCFAMAALRGRDGAWVLGTMGRHTANPGLSYFVAGMLEPADLADGFADFEGSLRRELAEETGLSFADLEAEGGWIAVFAGRAARAHQSAARKAAGRSAARAHSPPHRGRIRSRARRCPHRARPCRPRSGHPRSRAGVPALRLARGRLSAPPRPAAPQPLLFKISSGVLETTST